MNDYYALRLDLTPCSEDATDLLAAMLADIGYESFVPDTKGLTAYVRAEDYDAKAVSEVLQDFPFECAIQDKATLVPGQDWNAEWEKHYFQPIVVGGDCVIHSSFHTDAPKARYEIVIDPKMAFGTGHHSTTSLIIGQLLKMPLEGASVIDMGTGTGILAILAAMRGATKVTAIEIDECAYVNAVDNVASNGHPEIHVVHGDAQSLVTIDPADVFIANINRNIILADMAAYAKSTKVGGTMLLSGFYESDTPMLKEAGAKHGLEAVGIEVGGTPEYCGDGAEQHWACLILRKI